MKVMTFYRIVMVVFFASLAFLANPTGPFGEFWPPAPGSPSPTGILLTFFVILNIFEAVSLAVSLVMLLTAWPQKALKPLSLPETRLGFLSLVWILGNWWAHDALHVHLGENLPQLIKVEYGFHVTTMIITGYVIYLTSKLMRAADKSSEE